MKAASSAPAVPDKGGAHFLRDWLLSAIGAMAVLVAINADYFAAGKRFLGPHDTQIPYQAALNSAQQWWGSGVSLWNWYDQVDMAYSHLTTGWWTIPAALEGAVIAAVDAVVPLSGFDVLQTHAILWPTIQILVATLGMVALLRDLGIRSAIAIPTVVLGVGYLTAFSTFYYLTGFVYALTPLLIFATRRVLIRPSPQALLTWILLVLVSVAQSPLFSVGYALIPVFFFAFATGLVEVLAGWRDRTLRMRWRAWLRAWRPSAWLRALRTPQGALLQLAVCVLGLTVILVYMPLLESFSENLYLIHNRLENGFWNTDWLRQGLRLGADPSIALQASVNGTAATGWTYWGLMWPAMVLLGAFVAPRRAFLPFAVAAALVVSLQFNAFFSWELWQLQLPARLLVFAAYPGAVLFRGPTMVTLMLPYLAIPLAAGAVQVLWRSGRGTGASRRRRGTLTWLLAAAAAGLGWNLGQFTPQPILLSTILALVFCVVVAGRGAVPHSLRTADRQAAPLLFIGVVIATSATGIVLLRNSWTTPAYFGGAVEPRTFIVGVTQSAQFVPDYRALQRWNALPIVYAGPLPTIYPQSPSLLLPNDPTLQYFTPQTNSGLFWSSNIMQRYVLENYYQQVHKTVHDYLQNREAEAHPPIPPSLALTQTDGSDGCSLDPYDPRAPATESVGYQVPLAGAGMSANTRNAGEVVNLEIAWPQYMPRWRTNVFKPENEIRASADGVSLAQVQGYPTEAFAYDVGNWKDDVLSIGWPKNKPIPATFVIKFPSSATSGIESYALARNTLSVQVDAAEGVCLVAFQPWQHGWVGTVDEQPADVVSASGWIAIPVPAGTHQASFAFEPFGRWSDAVPFVLPGVSIASLLLIVALACRAPTPKIAP